MKKIFGRSAALLCALTVCLSNQTFHWHEVSASEALTLKPAEFTGQTPEVHPGNAHSQLQTDDEQDSEERLRASIILKSPAAIDYFGQEDLDPSKPEVIIYREKLEQEQQDLIEIIEQTAQDPVEICQQLDLAINAISLEASIRDLKRIENLEQAAGVELENEYEPAESESVPAAPMTSGAEMIGAIEAHEEGYKGQGSRIAIIDTGLNTDHQSFDRAAFVEQLNREAQAKNIDSTAYRNSLNLLDLSDLSKVLSTLHLGQGIDQIEAEDLYLSEKIPFAWNYVDEDTDVGHKNDRHGDHGSHVAGISAANSLIPAENGYDQAIETVLTEGVAPDAQILVMKVYGKNGGAYESDYFAAIEDALTLQCDAINLSLGSNKSGYTHSPYDDVMEKVQNSDAVVSISAANSGSWADQASTHGKLYADDVQFGTVGEPGSFASALTVASCDNTKYTSAYVVVGGYILFFEDGQTPVPSLSSLAGSHSYLYFATEWDGTEDAQKLPDLQDKIAAVRCSRVHGDDVVRLFEQKNPSGIILLCENEEIFAAETPTDIPVVVMSSVRGSNFQARGTALEDYSGVYSGTMQIHAPAAVDLDESRLDMSSFSSWGTNESLILKPEITAPGGYIYSIDGLDPGNKDYTTKSGTSMAAPQAAGMAAVLRSKIEDKGWPDALNLSGRVLAQALLMSTASPMKDASNSNSYWPVLQQGAGEARVDHALQAKTLIMMEADATHSWNDGKVKAELLDDPQKEGSYQFSFTLHNLEGPARSYNLSADLFTQKLTEDGKYITKQTETAGAAVQFSSEGRILADSRLELPAGANRTVTALLQLTEEQKQQFDEEREKGTWLEGFVLIDPAVQSEDVSYSIPVLGYYGSWSDPSAFERTTYYDSVKGTGKDPYFALSADDQERYVTNVVEISEAASDQTRYLAGNPYVESDLNDQNRSAMKPDDTLLSARFTAIRDGAMSGAVLLDETGKAVWASNGQQHLSRTYFDAGSGEWIETNHSIYFSAEPQLPAFQSGSRLRLDLLHVSEYYVPENADTSVQTILDLAANPDIRSGMKLSQTIRIDGKKPQIIGAAADPDHNTLELSMQDDFNVAYVAIYDEKQENLLYESCANDPTDGKTFVHQAQFDFDYGQTFCIVCADYARNETAVQLSIPSKKSYAVAVSASGCHGEYGDSIESGKNLSLNFEADEGYLLPEQISVSISGSLLSEHDYSWNSASGVFQLDASKITGNIAIVIEGVLKPEQPPAPVRYSLSVITAGCHAEHAETAEAGENLNLQFEADEGYLLPEHIFVSIGGNQSAADSYSWNSASGDFFLEAAQITGDIFIKAEGTSKRGETPAVLDYTLLNAVLDKAQNLDTADFLDANLEGLQQMYAMAQNARKEQKSQQGIDEAARRLNEALLHIRRFPRNPVPDF